MSDELAIPHLTWKEWLACAPTFTGREVVIEEAEELSLDHSVKDEWPSVKFSVSGKAKWRDKADEGPNGRHAKRQQPE